MKEKEKKRILIEEFKKISFFIKDIKFFKKIMAILL